LRNPKTFRTIVHSSRRTIVHTKIGKLLFLYRPHQRLLFVLYCWNRPQDFIRFHVRIGFLRFSFFQHIEDGFPNRLCKGQCISATEFLAIASTFFYPCKACLLLQAGEMIIPRMLPMLGFGPLFSRTVLLVRWDGRSRSQFHWRFALLLSDVDNGLCVFLL